MITNVNGIHMLETFEPPRANNDLLPDRPKIREVAAWLGMSYEKVRQLALEGEIPCKKIKRKNYNAYLFDKAALLEWARPEG